METKTCTRCGEQHAIEMFPENDRMTTGRVNQCRLCIRNANAARYISRKAGLVERKKRLPLKERFLEKISPEPNSGCWLWTARVDKHGYGRIRTNERIGAAAHRVSYEIFVGDIRPGLEIDHRCRVRCCVNPLHLEAVEPIVNWQRGYSPPAINARKTHCPRGHELKVGNLRHSTVGYRRCLACERERASPA